MTRAHVPVAVRRAVVERANGRCEYCLTPETIALISHEVDHIVAQKHGGPTELDNLALCCAICNKHKGTDLASIDPDTGQIAELYHPRRDRWADHFQLDAAVIRPLSPAGRATVRLLQLNHPDRIVERELLLLANELEVPATPSSAL